MQMINCISWIHPLLDSIDAVDQLHLCVVTVSCPRLLIIVWLKTLTIPQKVWERRWRRPRSFLWRLLCDGDDFGQRRSEAVEWWVFARAKIRNVSIVDCCLNLLPHSLRSSNHSQKPQKSRFCNSESTCWKIVVSCSFFAFLCFFIISNLSIWSTVSTLVILFCFCCSIVDFHRLSSWLLVCSFVSCILCHF